MLCRPSFDQKMQYHKEILELMDVVVTGDEVERGKPEPDIFLEAARRLGKDAARCVVRLPHRPTDFSFKSD